MAITEQNIETPEGVKAEILKKLESLLGDERSKSGPRRIARLRKDVPELDTLAWLQSQEGPGKVFWSDRDGSLAVAGVGFAVRKHSKRPAELPALFDSLRGYLSETQRDLRFYGGFRFDMDSARDRKWKRLGSYHFSIPEAELGREGNQHYLAVNLVLPETARNPARAEALLEHVRGLRFDGAGPVAQPPRVVSRSDAPSQDEWRTAVRELLDTFDEGPLKKVVLARETNFRLESAPNPIGLLRALVDDTTHCYHYCFQVTPSMAFVGASPERLYKRQSTHLQSEAVAATRPRGATPEEDDRLANELLTSDKELREHRHVVDSILEFFGDQCQAVQAPTRVELLPLRHRQHLLSRIGGMLRRPDCDAELLKGLHPTPAVGGVPRAAALERIAEVEPFERGWYTGPVGWVGYDATEFAVAIRPALVYQNSVSVYTGAGIVPGSEPDEEWDELENKLTDFHNILGASGELGETG